MTRDLVTLRDKCEASNWTQTRDLSHADIKPLFEELDRQREKYAALDADFQTMRFAERKKLEEENAHLAVSHGELEARADDYRQALDEAYERIHELQVLSESLQSQISSLRLDLADANAEIKHHHEDFNRIRNIVG